MRRRIISLIALLLSINLFAQQKTFTISGHISDSESGETLIGAGILSQSDKTVGTVSNEFGYYSITIPKDKLNNLKFTYSYVGYNERVIELSQPKDTILNITLTQSNELKEAVVVAHKEAGIKSNYLGSIEVPLQHIKQTPMLLGENDVLKSLQLLPGVQGGNEGFTGLFVRGGGPDENLVLLDGIPIYNVDHMLGLFSVFQADAVKKVTLYKGSFPARYSGRVSSIVDVRTNDGNMKETTGSFTLGIVSNKFHLEGPIIKDKLSYSFSARGLMTAIYAPLIYSIIKTKERANYYFYDINGKLTWRINDNDRLYLGAYFGSDVMSFKTDRTFANTGTTHLKEKVRAGTSWGNKIVSLRWNHIFNNQLFANTTVAYNHYDMGVSSAVRDWRKGDIVEQESIFDINYNSGIRDLNARIDLDYKPSSEHNVKFGGEYVFHTYTPQSFTSLSVEQSISAVKIDTTMNYNSQTKYYGNEASVYAEDSFNVAENLTLNPGLHFAWFNTQGKNYFSLQPRFSAKLGFDGYSFKAGYSRMAQYVHLLSSSSFSLPMDLWVPITKNIRPVTSDQFSLGVYGDWLRAWEFTLEAYFKLTNNILEYKEGTSSILGSSGSWEDNVEMGKGRAYGVEFMVEKTLGQLTGWVSYTLAKSERIFPDGSINAGRWFPYKYDRRHSINICLNYALNKKIDFNATWQFASGGTTTVPTGKTAIINSDGFLGPAEEVLHRNNYRLPSSHKLNIGANFHRKLKKGKGESIWNISVYNVYNQMNPNFIMANTYYDDEIAKTVISFEKLTILPIIPAFSYTRTF